MPTLSLAGVLTYLRRMSPPDPADEDADLLARFAAGDGAALEALVRRHAAMVWGVCRRMLAHGADAEDAFQATFLVLVRKARSLADGRPLAPWLHTVATRTAAKARALAYRRANCESGVAEPAVSLPDEAALREARAVVDEEIGRLPARYREAVMLCYLEGRTNDEAAKHLRCPKGTVLSRLSRARDWLRRRLERRGLAPSALGLGELFAPAEVPITAMTGAGRAGAASGGALALAEGVVTGMFVQKLKWVGAACLVAMVAIAGAGWVSSGARGGEDPKGPPPAAEAGKAAEKKAGARKDELPVGQAQKDKKKEDPPRSAREVLSAVVDFGGFDDPKATLLEALDQFAKVHRVTFDINERAFNREMGNRNGGTDILKALVADPPITPSRAPLERVLRKVLNRLDVPSGATFLIRKGNIIEITTEDAVREELGLGRNTAEQAQPSVVELVLVTKRINQEPLRRVLADLADETGENILLDPRVKKEADTELTAKLTNVPLETALNLLTDMAGLEVVRKDNVYYVTSPQNAAKFRRGDR